MKNLRFMLVTAFMLVCGVMSATEVTWQASGNSTLPTAIGEDITLAWTNASFSSSKPTAAYLSANGTLTVTAPEGMAVQSVTFKFSGENLSLTADPRGNYATDSWNNTGTWSGSANAVTFTAPSKRYITKITVTYITESSVPTTPVLSITQITNFDDTYDLDNDTKTLVVYYKNEGTDAQNAKLTLFVNNVENNVVNLNTIANGANTWVNLPYNKETIAAGAQTVKVSLTADGIDAIEESKTVTFTKAAPEATFSVAAANVNVAHDATSYQVVATVTNTSNVDATGVQVLLQKSLQNVAEPQAIDLAALASKDVTFTVQAPDGGFTAGATTMFVMVKAYEKNKAQQEVTVTVEEAPVQEVKDLAITSVDGTIDLGAETPQLRVIVQNNGTVDITDAAVVLKNGETTLGEGTVSAAAGQAGWTYIAINKTGLEAGTITVTASVTVEGDAAPADNTFTQDNISVVAAPVPTAAFTLTAAGAQTQVGDATFEVKVTVKNTGDAAGAATVQIIKGTEALCEAQTTQTLEVDGEETLTFTVNNPYTAAGTFELQAITSDNKAGCFITVTVAPAPVEEVKDLAITSVDGTIDLGAETPQLRVIVQNNGTVNITDAAVVLKNGETTLGEGTVSAAAGQTGWTYVTINKTGLEAGTITVTASVTVEGDATPADNTFTQENISVVAAPVPTAAFTLTAAGAQTQVGDATFEVKVTVKNTGDAAGAATVQIIKGTEALCEAQTTQTLEVDGEETLTFTVNNPYTAAGTFELQAITSDNKAGCFITVTVAPAPVEEVKDLAISQVSCEIDLAQENNYATVSVVNNGSVDITDATVTVKATINDVEQVLGTNTVSAKAGYTGLASVTLDTTGLTVGTLTLTIAVDVEGDATPADNTTTKEVTVADTTSGIAAVKTQLKDKHAQIYTLKGEKVSTVNKAGLYIVNGRKVVVK